MMYVRMSDQQSSSIDYSTGQYTVAIPDIVHGKPPCVDYHNGRRLRPVAAYCDHAMDNMALATQD